MKAAQAGLLLALLALALRAPAHEGHVHEPAQEVPPQAAESMPPPPDDSPRMALSGTHLELVVLRDGDAGLLIYADDYQSNAPLSGLSLQLRSGAHSVQAAPAGEGLYRVPAGVLPAREALPLQIIARGEHWQEQLDGVLAAETRAAPAASHAPSAWLALLLLPLALLVLRWRLRRRREAHA